MRMFYSLANIHKICVILQVNRNYSSCIAFVAGDVAGYLVFPEAGVRLGFDVLGATPVAVPEASVDEDDGALLGQHEVGGAGEALVIEPVPVALVPQCVPDCQLRACVPGTKETLMTHADLWWILILQQLGEAASRRRATNSQNGFRPYPTNGQPHVR